MTFQQNTVYGERIGDLLPGLQAFGDAMVEGDDGMFHSSVTLEPEAAQPLIRAMMRVEAELMLEDAEQIGSSRGGDRTPAQRSADALIRLVVTIGQSATTSIRSAGT